MLVSSLGASGAGFSSTVGLASQPNFLLLDEPTNDLDLPSIAALEDFLLSYAGVLVVEPCPVTFSTKSAATTLYSTTSSVRKCSTGKARSASTRSTARKNRCGRGRSGAGDGRSSRQAVAKGTEMEEKQQVEAGDASVGGICWGRQRGARMKPLSDFEIRVMEKLAGRPPMASTVSATHYRRRSTAPAAHLVPGTNGMDRGDR